MAFIQPTSFPLLPIYLPCVFNLFVLFWPTSRFEKWSLFFFQYIDSIGSDLQASIKKCWKSRYKKNHYIQQTRSLLTLITLTARDKIAWMFMIQVFTNFLRNKWANFVKFVKADIHFTQLIAICPLKFASSILS